MSGRGGRGKNESNQTYRAPLAVFLSVIFLPQYFEGFEGSDQSERGKATDKESSLLNKGVSFVLKSNNAKANSLDGNATASLPLGLFEVDGLYGLSRDQF